MFNKIKLVAGLFLAGAIAMFSGCRHVAIQKAEVVKADVEKKNEQIYTNSFEKVPAGMPVDFTDDEVSWKSTGESVITAKFAKTGKQSLHIGGGTDNTVELELKGELQDSRGISFSAERWTKRDPFKFRIVAQVNGNWKEAANLDKLVSVGSRFRSEIVVKLPAEIIGGIRLVCTAPEDAGILIDDFALLKGQPDNVTKAPEVATEPIKNIVDSKALFVSGTENTHTFRIPAIITAQNGDLIATCDARRKSGADLKWVRDIDIAVKRSSDNGRTWSEMELVCDFGDGKPASDPSLVLDEMTGEIFCFYNYMDQDKSKGEFRLYVQTSKDHGKTWGPARDITKELTPAGWPKLAFKFITSGRGMQTRDGKIYHTLVNTRRGVFVFGSEDHGKTWKHSDVAVQPADESKIIELANGDWMINSRVNGAGFRWVHTSDDNGKTWTSKKDVSLVDPSCNGVILRYTDKADGYKKNRLLFCNANSFKGRKNLTVKISYDEGKTWSKGKVVDAGPSAYSDMTICKDGTIGILYEPGYKEVRFTRISLKDLTDGEDKLCKPYEL